MTFSITTVNTALDPANGFRDPRLVPHSYTTTERVRYRLTAREDGSVSIQRGGTTANLNEITDRLEISTTDADNITAVVQLVPRAIKIDLPEPEAETSEKTDENGTEDKPTLLEQILSRNSDKEKTDLLTKSGNTPRSSVFDENDTESGKHAAQSSYTISEDFLGTLVDTTA